MMSKSKDKLGSSEQYDVSLKSCLHSKYTKKEILLLSAKQQSLENVVPFLFRLTNIIFCLSSKVNIIFFSLSITLSLCTEQNERSHVCLLLSFLSHGQLCILKNSFKSYVGHYLQRHLSHDSKHNVATIFL